MRRPPQTRATLLLERSKCFAKIARIDSELASLESSDAPATAPSSLSTADVVALALENANVRRTA